MSNGRGAWWDKRVRIFHRKINRQKFYGVRGSIDEYASIIVEEITPKIDEIVSFLRKLSGSTEADILSTILGVLGHITIGPAKLLRLNALLDDAFDKGGKRVLDLKGENIKIGAPVNRHVIEALQRQQTTWLEGFTGDLSDTVKDTVTNGIREGKDFTAIADEIQEKAPEITKVAARRAARSNIVEASNLGTIQTMREAGLEKYRWLSARDNRVCTLCRERDRDSPYMVGRGPVPVRDSHPNCRCVIIADTAGEMIGRSAWMEAWKL